MSILLSVLQHGAAGIWDEVLVIGLAIALTALFIGAWIASRRFEPEMEEDEGDEAGAVAPEDDSSRRSAEL